MLTRILLIDGLQGDAQALTQKLSEAGFDDPLFHIAEVQDALAYLRGAHGFRDRKTNPLPDVVFLDLTTPDGGGLELLKWIKSQPHLGRIIVIVLTSIQDLKTIRHAYEFGAHSFLSKEANTEEVRNMVAFLKQYAKIITVLPSPEREHRF